MTKYQISIEVITNGDNPLLETMLRLEQHLNKLNGVEKVKIEYGRILLSNKESEKFMKLFESEQISIYTEVNSPLAEGLQKGVYDE